MVHLLFTLYTVLMIYHGWKGGGKQIHEVFPALFLSLLAYIIVSLRTGVNEEDEVCCLFQVAGEQMTAHLAQKT